MVTRQEILVIRNLTVTTTTSTLHKVDISATMGGEEVVAVYPKLIHRHPWCQYYSPVMGNIWFFRSEGTLLGFMVLTITRSQIQYH